MGRMGKEPLARTVAALMVAGHVPVVDMRDARDAHRAVVELWDAPAGHGVCERWHVVVDTVPDPDVGVRVSGLTQAFWSAVALRYLEPVAGSSVLAVTDAARDMSTRVLAVLSGEERAVLAGVGQDWACRSTSRNTRSSDLASPAGM